MPPQRSAALDPTIPLNPRAQAQRERILDAAPRCFIARGFHAASVSDIATEAGISQGLMYRYFDNKRAMILALIERRVVGLLTESHTLRRYSEELDRRRREASGEI